VNKIIAVSFILLTLTTLLVFASWHELRCVFKYKTTTWIPTYANITSHHIDIIPTYHSISNRNTLSKGSWYVPVINYTFAANDKLISSNQIWLCRQPKKTHMEAEAIVGLLKKDPKLKIYYNSNNPKESYCIGESHNKTIITSVMLLLSGLTLFIGNC